MLHTTFLHQHLLCTDALPDWQLATTLCSAELQLKPGLFEPDSPKGGLHACSGRITSKRMQNMVLSRLKPTSLTWHCACCRQTVSCTFYWILSMVATYFSSCIDR